MSAASRDELSELHNAVARELRKRVEEGVDAVITDPESGERRVAKVSCSASDIANVIKFLSNNNIEAVVTPGSPVDKLRRAMEEDEEQPPEFH